MTESNFISSKKPFLCGVCEGFYGKPWTFSQRQELFKRMHRFGMNAYLYAPKDDYKHRLYWRDLYTEEEAEELRCLVGGAEGNRVRFIYAISPGLDIVYSSASDVSVLKKKLDQVRDLGCQSFALLFDDIEDELCNEDVTKFASIADAQCFLTNEIYNHLNQPDLFLFCPTEYCSSRSLPDVLKSSYLKTIGLRLDPRIEFLWTGPKVVSKRITAENVTEVGGVVRRQVTVWDNLHANDYDQTRLYLGPYSGRPTELLDCLRGVLTNPNCEFEANFVALHTLAQWSTNKVTKFPVERQVTMTSPPHGEADMEVEEEEVVESSERIGTDAAPPYKPTEPSSYEPRRALQAAVADWLPELYKTKSPFGQQLTPKTVQLSSGGIEVHRAKLHDDVGVGRSMEDYYEEGKVHDVDLESEPTCGKEAEDDQKKMEEEVVPMVADDDGQQGSVVEMAQMRRDNLEEDLDDEMKSKNAIDSSVDPKGMMGIGAYQQQQTSASVIGSFYYDYRKRQHDVALTSEEVVMICDFFYLPFEHGPTGEEMLKAATWLVDNFDLVYRSAPFHCYGSIGQRLATFLPHLSDSLSPCSSSPPESPISDRTASPPPPPLPILGQASVVGPVPPQQPLPTKAKPDKSVVFVNASLSTSTTLVGSTVIPVTGRVAKNQFLHDTYLGTPSASEWYERAIRFHDGYGDLSAVVDKLVNIPNRELLYELYKYVNDMRSNLALVNSYIKWQGIDKREKELFKSGEQEPWVHRGGLLAEFRRLLPFDRESSQTRGSNVFVVRPCYPKDRGDVNSVCLRTYNDTMDASYWLGSMPNLVGDCKIGAFLQYFSKYCYVLEDDLGICGYVVAADNIKSYRDHLEKTWLPEMRTKYPIIDTSGVTPEKKSATSTLVPTSESALIPSEDLRELSSATVEKTTPEGEGTGHRGEHVVQRDDSKEEGPCPMSSSEQSRSASPADCQNFNVFGAANRLKSQALSIEALLKALHSDHKPVLKDDDPLFAKYPSPVSFGLLYGKGSAAKLLLASIEQALANDGSNGMHVILPASHKASIEMYKRLGFKEEKPECSDKDESRREGAPDLYSTEDKNSRKEFPGNELISSVVLCKTLETAHEPMREGGFSSALRSGFGFPDAHPPIDEMGRSICSISHSGTDDGHLGTHEGHLVGEGTGTYPHEDEQSH